MASLKRQQLIKSFIPNLKLDDSLYDAESFSATVEKLSADEAQRVKLLLDLADLSEDNDAVVGTLAQKPEVKSLRDVAIKYNTMHW